MGTTLSTERIRFEQSLAALLAAYGFDGSVLGGGTGTILTQRLSIINYVKLKLDEISPEAEGLQFSLEEDLNVSDPLNIMINALLPEATKRVLLICPIQYLMPVKSIATAVANTGSDTKIGYIPLPDNFVRFVSLKMADWKRSVSEAISTIDPQYKSQANIYTRGGTAKPVVVMSHRTIATVTARVIEYYSINTSHTIDYLYYIQETAPEDLQINLIDALTWMCAGMVLQITERSDLAKLAFEQVQLSFQNL